MRSILCLLAALCIITPVGTTEGLDAEPYAQNRAFMRPGTWWGLIFEAANDPLRREPDRVPMIKVLAVDEMRPSWIKIAYPKDSDEHFAMAWKAGQKIEHAPDESPQEILAELEVEVKDWEVMWVNLEHAVSAIDIEQLHTPEPAASSVPGGTSSPPAQ